MFKKNFAKLNFSQALFEKIPSFDCLVFKIENKWKNCKVCFLKKQADLKTNYQAVAFRVNDYLLMITYDILKIKIEQKRKLDNFLF